MSGFKGFLGKVGLVVAASVTTAALASTGVAAASAVIPNNSVNSAKIINNTVKSADIKNNSVHSIDVTDNNLTGVDILDGSLGSPDLGDGSVTSADIADGTVASGDIADGTVGSGDIADGTVASGDIANGTVAAADLAPLVMTRWAKIDADASGSSLIRGRGAAGTQRLGAGQYTVTFVQDVTTCGWSATVNDNDTGAAPPLFATVERDGPNSNSILRVRTFDATGALADPDTGDGFTVTVTC
jgi:hypothetical protein